MKEQYGIGGQSHALSRADNSYADYNGKGLQLSRGNPGAYHTKEELSWKKVAKRVDYLIKNDHFLQAGDYAHMPEYERYQMAMRVINFYNRLPQEIERMNFCMRKQENRCQGCWQMKKWHRNCYRRWM